MLLAYHPENCRSTAEIPPEPTVPWLTVYFRLAAEDVPEYRNGDPKAAVHTQPSKFPVTANQTRFLALQGTGHGTGYPGSV